MNNQPRYYISIEPKFFQGTEEKIGEKNYRHGIASVELGKKFSCPFEFQLVLLRNYATVSMEKRRTQLHFAERYKSKIRELEADRERLENRLIEEHAENILLREELCCLQNAVKVQKDRQKSMETENL